MGEIKILDSTISNQIAAGEVVDRPASVVKELMENSVDAGATEITLVIVDAGQTLIQVIDNGKGMSLEDAKLSFVRHATSKISNTEDLWNLYTFGFRGEALASIASVSNVEMKTRQTSAELGTQILISGGVVSKPAEIQCPAGTSISVKNLFFNLPARRKFLKTAGYERQVIISEFEKIALANPDIAFTIQSEQEPNPTTYRASTLRDRIAAIAKKTIDKSLIPLSLETPDMTIKGWISSPTQKSKTAAKTSRFFVNGRYMRNPVLQKAVSSAYGKLLAQGEFPHFYIFININPAHIDINVHPTKTEVKFENESLIWQLLNSAVKRALGSASISPSIDFSELPSIEIPNYNPDINFNHLAIPKTTNDRSYNPFANRINGASSSSANPELSHLGENVKENSVFDIGAREFYEGTQQYEYIDQREDEQQSINILEFDSATLQVNGRYIFTILNQNVAVIDYPRALERITYERILETINDDFVPSQMELIPEQIELSQTDAALILGATKELSELGFEISNLDAGVIMLTAMPAYLSGKISVHNMVGEIIESLSENRAIINPKEKLALAISKSSAKEKITALTQMQMQNIIAELMQCKEPAMTSQGLPVIISMTNEEIEKKFKRR